MSKRHALSHIPVPSAERGRIVWSAPLGGPRFNTALTPSSQSLSSHIQHPPTTARHLRRYPHFACSFARNATLRPPFLKPLVETKTEGMESNDSDEQAPCVLVALVWVAER